MLYDYLIKHKVCLCLRLTHFREVFKNELWPLKVPPPLHTDTKSLVGNATFSDSLRCVSIHK